MTQQQEAQQKVYNDRKKLELIEEIIKTILGPHIDFIKLMEPQHVSFVKQWINNPQIFRLMSIRWDDNLHFQVQEYLEKNWRPVYIGSHDWFKVRDLMRSRPLDTDKLKMK